MDNLIKKLFSIAEEHATNDELKQISKLSESLLDATLINIQTIGNLIALANQSGQMDEMNNVLSGNLVEGLGNDAQMLTILDSDARCVLKQRSE